MTYRAWTAISLFLVTVVIFMIAVPSVHAELTEAPSAISLIDLDLGEREGEGGSFHVPLFALATLLGLVAAVTGIKNSSYKWLRQLVPLDLPRKLHRYASVACWSLFMVTFVLWTFSYYSDRGEIFHTTHGILALTTMAFALTSILTGMGMFRHVKRWRMVHIILSNTAFILLILTDITGAALGD